MKVHRFARPIGEKRADVSLAHSVARECRRKPEIVRVHRQMYPDDNLTIQFAKWRSISVKGSMSGVCRAVSNMLSACQIVCKRLDALRGRPVEKNAVFACGTHAPEEEIVYPSKVRIILVIGQTQFQEPVQGNCVQVVLECVKLAFHHRQ